MIKKAGSEPRDGELTTAKSPFLGGLETYLSAD